MTKHDTGWRPNGAPEYNGNAVYFHNIAPYELNTGEVDGEVEGHLGSETEEPEASEDDLRDPDPW